MPEPDASGLRRRRGRWRAAAVNLGVIVGLLAVVGFLPPDTSLSERRKTGILPVCLPQSAPPLVTGDPARPGFEVEMLDELAKRLGLRLAVNTNPAIGRDFNPRNWNLRRTQCSIVAGGLADTVQTRSFLQTIPTGLGTGWALIAPEGRQPGQGDRVAVLPSSGGLSRVALGSYLRGLGVRPMVMQSPDELLRVLASGEAAAGIAERFVAEGLELGDGFGTAPLAPDTLGGADLAIGLWKGDQTLKRAVARAFAGMERDGTLARIGERYGVASARWQGDSGGN